MCETSGARFHDLLRVPLGKTTTTKIFIHTLLYEYIYIGTSSTHAGSLQRHEKTPETTACSI